MKRFMRTLAAVVSGTALVATGMVFTAPNASPAICGFGDPVDLQSAFTSQMYAGVTTTTRIPFIYKYSDAGCLQGMIFTFVGGGGADVQAVRANVSSSGVSGEATAEWVPKALEYKLLVDVVYQFGSFSDQITTSRWTYEGPLGGRAFVPLPAPSAPYNVTADANNRSIRVRWSPPASNSSAVSEYVVTRLENGEVLCRTTALYCDANDLPDGAYTYQVESKNQIGVGGTSTPTIGVLVAPPNPPAFAGYNLDDSGRNIVFNWDSNTGTSAAPAVYRIYDTGGSEVCGTPVVPGQSMYSCTVTPPKAGSTYSLKVETGMGDSTSAPTELIKPNPDAFFKTCSKVKGQSRDCATGKKWTFEWCTKKGGKATLATSKGKKVKSGKAKKSSTCVKKKPYLTKFVITEKKTGSKQYVVTLPDKAKKSVVVTSRATLT